VAFDTTTFRMQGLISTFFIAGFYLVILVLLLVMLHIWKKLAARILWKLYTRVRCCEV